MTHHSEKPERRQAVLAAIAEHQDNTGWFPTYRDLVLITGYRTTSAVHQHVHALIERGLVEQNPRGGQIRITEAGRDELPIRFVLTDKVRF